MADNVFTSIEDLLNVQMTESSAGEDFVIINQEKGIKQITLTNLISNVLELIPTENNEFPESLNLDTLLKAITYKLYHLSAADIGYDGEINMEYGNLKNLLIFVLNKLNTYENGISSEQITYSVGADTPEHASELEGQTVEQILNYILNNYRYNEESVSSEEISVNTSSWESSGSTTETVTLQTALDSMYQTIINKSDKTKKIYASNSETIEFLANTTTNIAELNIKAEANTMLDITTCFTITCNVPGVITLMLYRGEDLIDTFEDALTTGMHTINQFAYTSLSVGDENSFTITTNAVFTPDYNTGDIDIPAVIDIGKLRLLYQGADISYNSNSEEEVI